MFELYKKRDLGDYIGDTILFIKTYAKNFLKIFFIINGAFLLLFGILLFWFLKLAFDLIPQTNAGINDPFNALVLYFDNNTAIVIGLITLFSLLFLLLSLFNYAYPILYLKLVGEGKKDFEANDIFTSFKQLLWRLIKFTIGSLFIIFPAMLIIIIALFLLCFIIVGIPLLIIFFPALFAFLHFSLFSYLTEENSFFGSLRHAYYLVKQDFWNTIGTTIIMMIIMQLIQGAITMFFYFVGIFIFLATFIGDANGMESKAIHPSPIIIALISIVIIAIMILTNIFNNIIIINQGIIYHSLEADDKNKNIELDLIGDRTNE